MGTPQHCDSLRSPPPVTVSGCSPAPKRRTPEIGGDSVLPAGRYQAVNGRPRVSAILPFVQTRAICTGAGGTLSSSWRADEKPPSGATVIMVSATFAVFAFDMA